MMRQQINLNTFLGGLGALFAGIVLYIVTTTVHNWQEAVKTATDMGKDVAVMQQSLKDIKREVHDLRDDVNHKHRNDTDNE